MATSGAIDRVGAGRRVVALTGVTDAGGNAVFAFVPPFVGVPAVSPAVGPTGNTNLVEARITALTAASCTINVRQSTGIVVLGITVLGLPSNVAGETVKLLAAEIGQGI